MIGAWCGTAALYVLYIVMLPPISVAFEAAARTQCRNNLKVIGLALHDYHVVYGCFPPACVADEDGTPMHSWRVLILPFLECKDLYKRYNMDEPWNGPTNRMLVDEIPDIYQCPSCYWCEPTPKTTYLAVVGARTMWPKDSARQLDEVEDPAELTLMVVEAATKEVNWMEPRDLRFEEAVRVLEDTEEIRDNFRRDDHFFFYENTPTSHPGGRQGLFADGTVLFLLHGLPASRTGQLLTIDDGVPLGEVNHLARPVGWRTNLKLANCFRLAVFVCLSLLPLAWVRKRKGTLSFDPNVA